MTDLTGLSRVGQINTAGDEDALFLKRFSGEVLTEFENAQIMRDLHMVRAIDSGKSAQFPALGYSSAGYHTPGAFIQGDAINMNERTINIDDVLLAKASIAEIDELKNHYDVRAEYARKMGYALGQVYDQNCLQVAVLAARASANVTGGQGGTNIGHANAKTDGAQLASMLFTAAQTMDEKSVAAMDRVCVVKPAQYYLLVQNKDTINKDWGGMGSYSKGVIEDLAGFTIYKSNNLPTTVISAVSGQNNTYSGDFSATAAICFTRDTMGTVQLRGLTTRKTGEEYKTMYNATLMTAQFVVGHGILNPASAVEIDTTP